MLYLCIGIFLLAVNLYIMKKMKKTTKKKVIMLFLSVLSIGGLTYGSITLTKSNNCCKCRDCETCDICCKCSYPYYYK